MDETSSRQNLLQILRETRAWIALPTNDVTYYSWDSIEEALGEMDSHIASVEAGDPPDERQLTLLFGPTGPIQELSIYNRWGKEFCEVAARFDAAIKTCKERGDIRPALPAGWVYPSSEEAKSIHEQLLRELHPDHILNGIPVETFARRTGNDDVLFRFKKEPGHFIVIHLSWQNRGYNANHPTVVFQGSFSGFVKEENRILGITST